MNVQNGVHYVLAYSYNDDIIYVNDPGSSNQGYYTIEQCVDGQTRVYFSQSGEYHNLLEAKKNFFIYEDNSKLKMAEK